MDMSDAICDGGMVRSCLTRISASWMSCGCECLVVCSGDV